MRLLEKCHRALRFPSLCSRETPLEVLTGGCEARSVDGCVKTGDIRHYRKLSALEVGAS